MPRPAKPLEHGKLSTYCHHRCRCAVCRECHRAYQASQYVRSTRIKPRQPLVNDRDDTFSGDVTEPTLSFGEMIGPLTPERLHCRVIMQNGVLCQQH